MEVFEPKKKKSIVETVLGILKAYFGFALLIIFLTIPAKGLWLLITFLWNLI